MNISDVYKELTSKIIGQDEQIKQILSTIWKQYNNEDKTFNYNMLINIQKVLVRLQSLNYLKNYLVFLVLLLMLKD